MKQAELFTGKQLAEIGIKKAVDHADLTIEDWSNMAYAFLETYLESYSDPFQCEDFRAWAYVLWLPEPPSLRAFGAIIRKASKNKLIRQVGYRSVLNPKAHKAVASVWVKC